MRSSKGRQRSPLPVIVLIFVGLFASGIGLGQLTDVQLPTLPSLFRYHESDAGRRSRPTRVSIPAISVHAAVAPVGRAADGSIAVPDLTKTKTTGWYERGPSPGEPGAAVIVGHVDDKKGPSIFYRLHSLHQGDKVVVTRKDHKVLTFVVDAVGQYPKDKFPTGAVFTAAPGKAALRLITCGGDWVGGSTGYADNVIVFASLA